VGSLGRPPARLVAGLAALAVLLAGVSIAGSRSLPGQPFYAVKRAGEQIQLGFAIGPRANGTRHLQFARTRLHEVRALLRDERSLGPAVPGMPQASGPGARPLAVGADSLVASTLRDMNAQTRAAHHDLTLAYRTDRDAAVLRQLARFAAAQQRSLGELLPELTSGARRAAGSGLTLLSRIDDQTQTMLTAGTCTSACRHAPAGRRGPSGKHGAPGCGCSTTPPAGHQRHHTGPAPARPPASTSRPAPSTSPQREHHRTPKLPHAPTHPAPKHPGGRLPSLPPVPPSAPSHPLPSRPHILPSAPSHVFPSRPHILPTHRPSVHLPLPSAGLPFGRSSH
jgi:hypothetical protein